MISSLGSTEERSCSNIAAYQRVHPHRSIGKNGFNSIAP